MKIRALLILLCCCQHLITMKTSVIRKKIHQFLINCSLDELCAQAKEFELAGNHGEAKKLFERAHQEEIQKNYPATYTFEYADYLARSGEYHEAVDLFSRITCSVRQKAYLSLAEIYEYHLKNLYAAKNELVRYGLYGKEKPFCPQELVEFYQRHETHSWLKEFIDAYHKGWHFYALGLLFQLNEHQSYVYSSTMLFMKSIKTGETPSAVMQLIEEYDKKRDILLAWIEDSSGTQEFKIAARKLIDKENNPTSIQKIKRSPA